MLKRTTKSQMEDSEFARFWAAYPRRVGKADALKAFQQVGGNQALVDLMIAALDWQRNTPQWTRAGGQFVPYPGSWLRGRRWEDEPFEPPQFSERTSRLIAATREFLQ